jgi:hypothetical protein
MYKLIHGTLQALNNKISVSGIFCDIAKAFDCVNHGILKVKASYHGTNRNSGKCF